MTDLVSGANRPLPDGMVSVSLVGPFDLSALVTGADGKVSGDGDFVFYIEGYSERPLPASLHLSRRRSGDR